MLPIVNLWLKSADIKHSGRWGKGNGSVRFRQADRTATEAGHWENCKPNNSSLWLSCGGVSTSKKQKSRRIWRGSLWTGIRLASLKSHTTQNCGQLLQPHEFWVVIGGDTNVRDVIIVSFTHTNIHARWVLQRKSLCRRPCVPKHGKFSWKNAMCREWTHLSQPWPQFCEDLFLKKANNFCKLHEIVHVIMLLENVGNAFDVDLLWLH